MDRRQYSLLLRLYRNSAVFTDNGYFDWMRNPPTTVKALMTDFGLTERNIYETVWRLKTPPSMLGIRCNGAGYYAAKGSRSCLLDFYRHNGSRLKRSGWLRPEDK